jgi:PleD family two-component response regulator
MDKKMAIYTPTFKLILASENITYRNNLASKLRAENFDVELATGGFHLLHLLEKDDNINIVICNGDMNDMAAFEIISLVRESKDKEILPIVFISKAPYPDEVGELFSVGINEYIVQTPSFGHVIERAQKYFQQMKGNAA